MKIPAPNLPWTAPPGAVRLWTILAWGCLSIGGSLNLNSARAQDTAPAALSPEQAAADPDYSIQGEYLSTEAAAEQKGVQVAARGGGLFRMVIYSGGLPGAGWDRKAPQVMEEEDAESVQDLLKSLKVSKTSRVSPTLSAVPPAGAVVLFDGTAESLARNWKPGARQTAAGTLQAGATTQQEFTDYSLHLEFRTPYMPTTRGQARGNSGVYQQGRYETQVLDSFALPVSDQDCGAIYKVRAPTENLCLPPLTWQTYDIDFTAPRFDQTGEPTAAGRLTVRLNGIVVQREVPVQTPTGGALSSTAGPTGPIFLQNHGNPVEYRNIWLMPRNADQEARRPRIPGYERFHALAESSFEGGVLLMGELGCVHCHKASDVQQASLLSKQAPILTEVGNRVRPEWIARFLADPHGVKPGTTMPNLLAGKNESERLAAAEALSHFLAATGSLRESNPSPRLVQTGETLFNEVGCVICHAPEKNAEVAQSTSVPLSNLADKYSIPSLMQFLKDPLAVRPSGRMPSLHLEKNQPEQIAHYLLRQGLEPVAPNVRYKVYTGRWNELPNFDELQPVKEGVCVGFDLSVAGKSDNFGIRFEAFLPDQQRGAYVFALGSDDGARLFLDGEPVLDTDGIHPVQMRERTARFEEQPVHTIRVDYFEATGGEDLIVMLGKQGAPLEHLAPLLVPDRPQPAAPQKSDSVRPAKVIFKPHPELVAEGRRLFISLGCANCHELKEKGQLLKSTRNAPPLAALQGSAGCLSATAPPAGVPQYDLTSGQRKNLELALVQDWPASPDPEVVIGRTLTAMNCYACHERHGIGGPETARNELFQSTQPEMGDEGRLPPTLNGVGDKLQTDWLKKVLDQGARQRPYMLTRMPRFGGRNIGHLAQAWIARDRRGDATLAQFDEPVLRVKSTGRQLVGNGGLACIKCHTFGDKKSTGIQAISLTGMTARLRPEWFLRYVQNPTQYRPGTRMPTGFPDGQAVVKDVYHGNPNQQISAIWTYLSDGDQAGLPEGLVAELIELKPVQTPIIYRNFIEGVSPRAIAVGYPEKAHLAWDANEFCLKMIWHDRFLDASMHWTGRGTGNQSPLGDHLLTLEPAFSWAVLKTPDQPWPQETLRGQSGYQFLGYQLDAHQRPAFRYRTPFGIVTDKPEPLARNAHEGMFHRVLTLEPLPAAGTTASADSSAAPAGQLMFRAATGKTIHPEGDRFLVDGTLNVRVTGGEATLRSSQEHQELLVNIPLPVTSPVTMTQDLEW